MRPVRFPSILAGAFMLLWALAASAAIPEEPLAVEPASFRIETITVESTREAAAGIIEAETLLKEGGTYDEDDLRQAVSRVHRLPFVLGADFSLRKGSERGAYELVIQAHSARWFFFDHGYQFARFDQLYALDTNFGSNEYFNINQTGLIGARVFLGRSGVLYGSFGLQQDSLNNESGGQVGYTRYDLLGRGIVANVSYARHACCGTVVLPFGIDPNLAAWDWEEANQASLNLAIPMSAHRSLQFGWTERQGESRQQHRVLLPSRFSNEVLFGGDQSFRRVDARWVQDTSDDPLLPSRGTVLSAGLAYASYEAEDLLVQSFSPTDPPTETPRPPFQGEQILAELSGTRHWSVTPRQSVSAGGRVSFGQSRVTNLEVNEVLFAKTDLDVFGGSVSARHLLRLRSHREPGDFSDLYLETGATFGVEATSPDLELRENPLERMELSTGITWRNQWGRLRFIFTYLDLGEVLW
ncbi:MAG TPA: hypothetical protein VNW71_05730 [Thermoanaerobaculia bacterium]|nr:hypothetical protein [Thermoanaerobaculia bacterium]